MVHVFYIVYEWMTINMMIVRTVNMAIFHFTNQTSMN